ncbi:MAG: response regulator transcription factor [Breznakiellaceae bacterium]
MNEKPIILIIEDERDLVVTIGDRLTAEGYSCDAATTGPEGYEKALKGNYGLILLDIMLPGKNGFDICRDLRAQGIQTPVLMLTARTQTIDKVLGLKLGADDYLCKPFDMEELMARIEAILRRTDLSKEPAGPALGKEILQQKRGKEVYELFTVDFSQAIIERDGEKIPLSAQEYKVLVYLTQHPNEVVSRETLLNTVWGYETDTTTRTVDVHIAWLRKKIGDHDPFPRHIHTVRGLGYRFVP